MFWRSTQLVAILLLLSGTGFSQVITEDPTKFLVDPTKPPVYIEFVRTGKCRKGISNFNLGDLCNSKSDLFHTFKAAWLRLVNNSIWSVGLTVDQAATSRNASSVLVDSTKFITADGKEAYIAKMVANNGAEMDVVYNSEVETACDFSKKAPKGQSCFRRRVTAPEISLPSLSSSLFVAPGQSIVFPIERSHVIEYVNLYVLYNFEWEFTGGKSFLHFPHYDSQHRAYYGWFELAEAIKAEREAKSIG